MSTPGPWFVGTQNDALFIINRPPRPSHDDMANIRDVQVIAKVNDCKGDDDARLIASAPDMLAALRAEYFVRVAGYNRAAAEQIGNDARTAYAMGGTVKLREYVASLTAAALAKAEGTNP